MHLRLSLRCTRYCSFWRRPTSFLTAISCTASGRSLSFISQDDKPLGTNESISIDDDERVKQLQAMEVQVNRLKRENNFLEGEETASTSSSGNSSGDVVEPTLADLDRSIPQVDCEFIASLVRCRNYQKEQFLQKKASLKERVAATSEQAAKSLLEASTFQRVGGLKRWMRGISAQEEDDIPGKNVSSDVIVSPKVLAELSPEEKDLLDSARPEYDDGFILLDCRTVNEVTSWGIIEGAKVLPAHELFDAFHSSPEEFEENYGFKKPHPEQIIICYCQYGPRSLMAAQILSWMGYLKVLHFRDGYYEWGKQYNLLLRRWMEHDKTSGNELRRLATFRAGLELQREIAPEFNALPMQEASAYRIDASRSLGTLKVGEGLRAEAYSTVASLTESLPLLEGNSKEKSTDESSATLEGGDQRFTTFLEQATGINPASASSNSIGFTDAGAIQEAALQSSSMEHVDPLSKK